MHPFVNNCNVHIDQDQVTGSDHTPPVLTASHHLNRIPPAVTPSIATNTINTNTINTISSLESATTRMSMQNKILSLEDLQVVDPSLENTMITHPLLKAYRKTKHARRFFCSRCGSWLFMLYDPPTEIQTCWLVVGAFAEGLEQFLASESNRLRQSKLDSSLIQPTKMSSEETNPLAQPVQKTQTTDLHITTQSVTDNVTTHESAETQSSFAYNSNGFRPTYEGSVLFSSEEKLRHVNNLVRSLPESLGFGLYVPDPSQRNVSVFDLQRKRQGLASFNDAVAAEVLM